VKGIKGTIVPSVEFFREEERSKQNSIFSVLREIKSIFSHESSGQLGLYGSFGYDLTFQFEEIQLNEQRKKHNEDEMPDRDLILFFPDKLFVLDNQKKTSFTVEYDFSDISCEPDSETDSATKALPGYSQYAAKKLLEASELPGVATGPGSGSTHSLVRASSWSPYVPAVSGKQFDRRDYPKGFFAESVKVAKNEFRVGNLFEVVLSQAFREILNVKPSKVFRR
jgi:anthranilate synthase